VSGGWLCTRLFWFWQRERARPDLLKLLLLWLTFHSFNAVFGPSHYSRYRVYYVPDWLFNAVTVPAFVMAGLFGQEFRGTRGYFAAIPSCNSRFGSCATLTAADGPSRPWWRPGWSARLAPFQFTDPPIYPSKVHLFGMELVTHCP
jgi:hypothetical protein